MLYRKLSSLSWHSPRFYGATPGWALFNGIVYLLMATHRDQKALPDLYETYPCLEHTTAMKLNGHSICTNQNEKNRLAVVTASFALTITAWVGALAFLPDDWIDSLSSASPWICCIATIVLWPALSAAMYLVFRASSKNPRSRLEDTHVVSQGAASSLDWPDPSW